MNKRRIRVLRAEWRRTHGGEAPEETRGEWGIGRLWPKIGGKRREQEIGVRLRFSRSRRRRMKRQHLHPAPEGRRLERLWAIAKAAFRPKKRRRDSNRGERGHRTAAASSQYRRWEDGPVVAPRHDPRWPVGRTAEDGSAY